MITHLVFAITHTNIIEQPNAPGPAPEKIDNFPVTPTVLAPGVPVAVNPIMF